MYFVENYSEKILPTQVHISTDNHQITKELYSDIYKELAKAKKPMKAVLHF